MYFMMELGKRSNDKHHNRERGPFLQEINKYQHVTCFMISEHCKDYVLFCSSFHPDADDVFMFLHCIYKLLTFSLRNISKEKYATA